MAGTIKEETIKLRENLDKLYAAGKKSEHDSFWDAYQENGNRTHYVGAFNHVGWTDITYQPKYPIISNATFGLQQVFSNSKIVDTKVDIILRDSGNMGAIFNGCTYLKRIPSLILESVTTNTQNAFTSCINLEEITVTCNGGMFASDIDMRWSTKLSRASILSVINALSEAVTGPNITFSKTAVENAFGSTTAAEWIAMKNSRPDWNIETV